MSEVSVSAVVYAAFGAATLGFAAYNIVRFMRGTIKLSLPGRGFHAGDTIKGSFELHAKKTIDGIKLSVTLTGTRKATTYQDGQRQTFSYVVFIDEADIAGARVYPAGSKGTYQFELATPIKDSQALQERTTGQATPITPRFLVKEASRVKWRVEARLHAKGVDLAHRKAIRIIGQSPI